MKKALKASWHFTLPIMAGYIFLGITFGLLMRTSGYPLWLPVVMSVLIYSGALEFAAVPILAAPFDPVGSFIMGLLVSARHLFYGISMLKKYENLGKAKLPLIFTLTDESYSVLATEKVPEGVEPKYFYLTVSLLNYSYWVIGTTVGALFGQFISFDTTGIDFALTALFIVLFLEQIRTKAGIVSGFIGLAATICVLVTFGSSNLVILSMIAILIALLMARKEISHE